MKNQTIKQSGPIGDHLANERTFLAWIRTSVGIMAFGFVVEKFSLFLKEITFFIKNAHLIEPSVAEASFQESSSILGILLAMLGALMCLFSFIKYKKIGKQIETAAYYPSTVLNTVLAISIFLAGLFLVIYLISSVATPWK